VKTPVKTPWEKAKEALTKAEVAQAEGPYDLIHLSYANDIERVSDLVISIGPKLGAA
jgi:hypothetical protein